MKTKKFVTAVTAAVLVVSSCGTYTGQGAYAGGSFGSVLGSAIGGIAGGWRGSDIGTVVGMAGGAAIGAAMGAAADQKKAEQMEQYKRERESRQRPVIDGSNVDDSGFDKTNSGDDRIDFDAPGPRADRAGAKGRSRTENGGPVQPVALDRDVLQIRHARVEDADHDGVLRAGEECKISFEVMNHSSMTVYDVQPLVAEVTGNKRIHISPNLHVESIAPHSGIRYTATLLADKKLKDGTAVIRVGVAQGSQQLTGQSQEFTVQTSRR